MIIPVFATFTGRKFAEPWVAQSCLNICCTFGVVLITSTSCNPTYLFWQFNVQNSIAKMASPICGGAKISPGLGLDHCFVCWCHQTSPLPEVSNEWLKARNSKLWMQSSREMRNVQCQRACHHPRLHLVNHVRAPTHQSTLNIE